MQRVLRSSIQPVAVSGVRRTCSVLAPTRPGLLRSSLRVECRQGRDPRGQRYQFRERQPQSQFTFDVRTIPQDQLWRLALPAAGLVGLAALAGPLIIGLTVAAVAVGAAVSMGAFALTSMFLPLAFLGLFGMMSFGAFATLGMFLVVPKLILTGISVGVLGAGALLGWGGVNWLTSLQQAASGSSSQQNRGRGTAADPWVDQLPNGQQQQAQRYRSTPFGAYSSDTDQTMEEDQQRQREMEAELRAFDQEFDQKLAEKQRQERRAAQPQDRDIWIE